MSGILYIGGGYISVYRIIKSGRWVFCILREVILVYIESSSLAGGCSGYWGEVISVCIESSSLEDWCSVYWGRLY